MVFFGRGVRVPLQGTFWSFLKPFCNLGLVPDFLKQRSEPWEIPQSSWYRGLTISSVVVKEAEAADVCKAELLNKKKRVVEFENLTFSNKRPSSIE